MISDTPDDKNYQYKVVQRSCTGSAWALYYLCSWNKPLNAWAREHASESTPYGEVSQTVVQALASDSSQHINAIVQSVDFNPRL